LAPIPQVGQWLAIAINIWATVVLIGGVIVVMNTPKVRTIVTFVLIFFTFVTLAFLASLAGRPQFSAPLAANDLGNPNFDVTDEELDAQLDDLVGKQGQKPAAGETSKAAAPTKK
jgi:hypothetical protein